MNENNKNAEKWTIEEAHKIFDLIWNKTSEIKEYLVHGAKVDGFNCHFIGEACDEAGTNIDIIKYVRNKHSLNDRYLAIKRKCERNCFTDAKKGIIIPSLAIMNLKSNHGWTDRVDNTSKGNEIKSEKVTISFKKKK